MLCKNCGTPINVESQKFCSQCGTPISQDATLDSSTELTETVNNNSNISDNTLSNKTIFFNGIDAIIHSVNAYENLKSHAIHPEKMLDGFKLIVDKLVVGNPALTMFKQNNDCFDSIDDTTLKIGDCICNFQKNCDEVRETIATALNSREIKNEGLLSFDFSLDPTTPFSMTIESSDVTPSVTSLVEDILFGLVKNNPKTNFRCFDGIANGSNFIHSHKLIQASYELSAGKIFTSPREISEAIDLLVKKAANTVSTLGSTPTLKEYNQTTNRQIDPCLVIIFADRFNYNDDMEKIRKMIKNNAKTGLSFIIVGKKEFVKYFYEASDYDITYNNGVFYIDEDEYVSFNPNHTKNDNLSFDEIIKKLEAANKIDTVFSHHPDLVNQDLLKMSSEKMLRIPFALDSYNEYQYLEVGGKADDAHCLLSGGTGCGKSTTLHSIIMQIVRNYHPDEAEIWAIDCKGVEFNRYVETNTPHFRVIACGNEEEMLLNVIDKIWEEYQKRLAVFSSVGAQDLETYRKKSVQVRAMPRVFVVIDEFHMMTAAAFNNAFTGTNYSDRITQIMKLVRATGIILLLSSQTVTMGLKGVSQDAINQAGARLCMKHEATNSAEIRFTLQLTGSGDAEIIDTASHFGKGQVYSRLSKHPLVKCNSLWIDNWKEEIARVNALIGDDYTPKERIFAMAAETSGTSKRPQIEKMVRHPLQKFVTDHNTFNASDEVEWYPAAPITLDDYFRETLTDAAGENMLIVGNNKELTDSVIFFSVLSFLMSPSNKVIINFVNPTDKSRQFLLQMFSKIKCDRLTINTELQDILDLISTFERVYNPDDTNIIYLWFGLNKLENEIFNLNDSKQNIEDNLPEEKEDTEEDVQEDNNPLQVSESLRDLLSSITSASEYDSPSTASDTSNTASYTQMVQLLQRVIERGPDNKIYNFVYFKTYKEFKKTNISKLQEFERRIGTTMSIDDSADLFGSGAAVSKTDDDTVIYYGGSGSAIALRPYHLPGDEWITEYNNSLKNI